MENIEKIIKENEGLIYKIINKYKNHFELDDLYQVAVMGILKAYKNYNSEYGTKFTSYAYPFILGEVIKYINEYRNIKIGKTNTRLYTKILKAIEILSQKMMKIPSNYELSLFLEIDESLIEEIICSHQTIESLDKVISEDSNNLELYNKFGYNDYYIENYELISELDKLTEEEKNIIKSRYYDNLSQSETGAILGMYQMEVSRKEKKILSKLKDSIAV